MHVPMQMQFAGAEAAPEATDESVCPRHKTDGPDTIEKAAEKMAALWDNGDVSRRKPLL